MSAELLHDAADEVWNNPARVVEVDLSECIADLLSCMADAYDFCAERWVDADEAARDKVHGYEAAIDMARAILGREAPS